VLPGDLRSGVDRVRLFDILQESAGISFRDEVSDRVAGALAATTSWKGGD
jgi:hypothetical protein